MSKKDISKLNLEEIQTEIFRTEEYMKKLIERKRILEKKTDREILETWVDAVFEKEEENKFFRENVIKTCDAKDFVCTVEYDGYESIVKNKFLKKKYGITGFRDVQRGQHFFIDSGFKYDDFKDIPVLSIEELKKLIFNSDFSKFKEEITAYLLVWGIANRSENEIDELYEKDITFTF